MNAARARISIILAILRRDLGEFARDRFFVYMTILGLVFYVAVFWIMPDRVNETIKVGVAHSGLEAVFEQAQESSATGLEFVEFSSPAGLRDALGLGDTEPEERLDIGLEFPESFVDDLAAGRRPTVTIYVDAAMPDEVRRAMASFVRETAFALSGTELPVVHPAQETIILGEDRTGDQVTLRERMRPLYAFFVLLVETLALGALVVGEIQTRTVTALLVTPARISDFLTAKVILGVILTASQAVLLLLLIRAFDNAPLIMLTAVLLGAVLVTGLGLMAGAVGRDSISTMFYSMLFMIPLAIPAIGTLFPGSASIWVKVLPSYGIVQSMIGASIYREGWADAAPHLAMAAAWCAAVLAAGLVVLDRRVKSL